MLLYGKPVVKTLRDQTRERVKTHAPHGAYVAFLLCSDDVASRVYIKKKCAYATLVWLETSLYESSSATYEEVIFHIHTLNQDPCCLWIIVQLPLADHLRPHQAQILSAVTPQKDVDGLNGDLFGQHLVWVHDFLPATPKAVFALLDYYQLGDLMGKQVVMIGQSNLMGKPFVLEAMARRATVVSTNSRTDTDFLRFCCSQSDLIVTAVGVPQLLTPALFEDGSLSWKVIIDVGYGIKNGKAYGDTDWEWLSRLGAHITPVPWGIWPVTVATLFHNLLLLSTLY